MGEETASDRCAASENGIDGAEGTWQIECRKDVSLACDNCAHPVIRATDVLSIRDALVSLWGLSELDVAENRERSHGVRPHPCVFALVEQVHEKCLLPWDEVIGTGNAYCTV